MKKHKGFTLIELLVVIAIIGVLATIVLVSLSSARQKGRDAKRIADVKQLQLALELYYDASSTYPAALANLAPDYIPSEPKDPSTGASYKYCIDANSKYHLGAELEDASHNALSTDQDFTAISGNCNDPRFGTDPVYDVMP